MSIDAFQTYKYFMAIKLHLTTDRYDVFESNGKVSGSKATFETRNDRFLFQKLGQKFSQPRELIEYLTANIGYGNKNVIYSSESDENYEVWLKRKEARTYLFKQQLEYIRAYLETDNKKFEDLFSIEDNVPELLKMYVGGHIHLETMIIINDVEEFLPKWEPLIMLWGDQLRILNKIKNFVKYDKDKLKLIYHTFRKELSEN
jgi:hypothetical protein